MKTEKTATSIGISIRASVWASLPIVAATWVGLVDEASAGPTILRGEEFGCVADGVTDDGPALQRMVERAQQLSAPTELRLPKHGVLRAASGVQRYAFLLEGLVGVRIDGQGSELRLAPELRLLRARQCVDLEVANLKVDFLRQPTVSGTVQQVDAASQSMVVQLDDAEMAGLLGGPTREDGEQAFFGMARLEAAFGTTRLLHFYVEHAQRLVSGLVRVGNSQSDWREVQRHVRPGETRIGLPVPGVAHRYGPGPLVDIDGCRDVAVSDVEVWSAPWFAFRLMRNEGRVALRRVHVRPKPGSSKVLSACRDAIHAKGNRATLLLEDCVLDGLGDDAVNLATHCSRIQEIVAPTQIRVAQHYPLGHIPFRPGDTLVAMSPEANRRLLERRVVAVQEVPSARSPRPFGMEPWAPESILTLDEPLSSAVAVGHVVWGRESANPLSVLRRCVIRRSCRLQTPVVFEECDVAALLWCYGSELEGPGPESVVVAHSTLKSNSLPPGRTPVLLATGWEGSRVGSPPSPADALLRSVELRENRIWGAVEIRHALRVEAIGNRVEAPSGGKIEYVQCREVAER